MVNLYERDSVHVSVLDLLFIVLYSGYPLSAFELGQKLLISHEFLYNG